MMLADSTTYPHQCVQSLYYEMSSLMVNHHCVRDLYAHTGSDNYCGCFLSENPQKTITIVASLDSP